jgi:hypothetical protein
MTAPTCSRCRCAAQDEDRFCGGCGATLPTAALTRAVDEACGDAVTVPIPRLASVAGAMAAPPPASGPAARAAGAEKSSDEGPRPTVSARQEVREVLGEVAAEWRGMSGTEKAGAAVATVYNGFATLWNVGLVLVVVLAIGLWIFSGFSAGLSASSTCDDYMKTDQQTRYTAAQELGRKTSGSGWKGPMAGLNLDYSCSYASGSRTIGSIMGIKS